jgi:hypothetical protein
MRKNPDTGEVLFARYFSKLSFSYTFKPEDEGHTVVFAYSVPYGYTDLVKDLDEVKEILIKDDSFEQYVPLDNQQDKNYYNGSDEETSPMPKLS